MKPLAHVTIYAVAGLGFMAAATAWLGEPRTASALGALALYIAGGGALLMIGVGLFAAFMREGER